MYICITTTTTNNNTTNNNHHKNSLGDERPPAPPPHAQQLHPQVAHESLEGRRPLGAARARLRLQLRQRRRGHVEGHRGGAVRPPAEAAAQPAREEAPPLQRAAVQRPVTRKGRGQLLRRVGHLGFSNGTLERRCSRIMLSPPQSMKPYLGHKG